MSDVKQIIILRKDLGMRKGKMVAQGAHASWKAVLDIGYEMAMPGGHDAFVIPLNEDHGLPSALQQWVTTNFKKITVYVNSEEELIAIYDKAREHGLLTALIVDSGLTEFKGVPTKTAVAVGPAYDDELDPITGHLPLL